ncbi:hypothetical protein ACR78C_07215 [Sphingobacterium spiritivorum]
MKSLYHITPKLLVVTNVADWIPFFERQLNQLKNFFHTSLFSALGAHLYAMSPVHEMSTLPVIMMREISPFKDMQILLRIYCLFEKDRTFVNRNTSKESLRSRIDSFLALVSVRVYYRDLRYQNRVGKKRKLLMFIELLNSSFAFDGLSQVMEDVGLFFQRVYSKELAKVFC